MQRHWHFVKHANPLASLRGLQCALMLIRSAGERVAALADETAKSRMFLSMKMLLDMLDA